VAFAAPKPTSINAVAIANDEFEKLITYPFKIESENQFDAAALGSDSPRRKGRRSEPMARDKESQRARVSTTPFALLCPRGNDPQE
jgi:hypothetical protein